MAAGVVTWLHRRVRDGRSVTSSNGIPIGPGC